jgi:hypothetical protein
MKLFSTLPNNIIPMKSKPVAALSNPDASSKLPNNARLKPADWYQWVPLISGTA